MDKKDKSPVTVADFGAQAVINIELLNAFPEDPIMAEEDFITLETEEGAGIRARIVERVTAVVPGLSEDTLFVTTLSE